MTYNTTTNEINTDYNVYYAPDNLLVWKDNIKYKYKVKNVKAARGALIAGIILECMREAWSITSTVLKDRGVLK
jgi:hypothetical protein